MGFGVGGTGVRALADLAPAHRGALLTSEPGVCSLYNGHMQKAWPL